MGEKNPEGIWKAKTLHLRSPKARGNMQAKGQVTDFLDVRFLAKIMREHHQGFGLD